jgi:hypothetical protein
MMKRFCSKVRLKKTRTLGSRFVKWVGLADKKDFLKRCWKSLHTK